MLNNQRSTLKNTKRWVIKIGSSLLTDDGKGLNNKSLNIWTSQMVQLLNNGVELVLVSSGAVATGLNCLGLTKRPKVLHKLQAVAAVGQMSLINAWHHHFANFNRVTAQILLTHNDFSCRDRYLNARSTLGSLLKMGTVAVINENDTVATEQIGFGDNDSLGALVANLIDADLLIMLTDQDGLFDKNPRLNDDANLVQTALADDPKLNLMAGDAGSLGRGGMQTKIRAARIAASSGAHSIIVSGKLENVLLRIYQGENVGTLLTATKSPLIARKQWLAGHLKTCGSFTLDEGAVKAIKFDNKSLLPIGVTSVTGNFNAGEMVRMLDASGNEIARGLSNYSSIASQKICGKKSDQIADILGRIGEHELIHRDNLVLV